MNYKKHYDVLIERARFRELDGYKEKHHIVPCCMGGADDNDNLVDLTAEEHFVAHQLLVKMHPEELGLVFACHRMTHANETVVRNNKMYSWLRKRHSDSMRTIAKQRKGKKNGSYGKSWYYDPVTLENIKCVTPPIGFVKGRRLKPLKILQCEVCGESFEFPRNARENKTCSAVCATELMSRNTANQPKHTYDVIYEIYKEHKKTGTGFYTLAPKYGVNKWSVYDYMDRYKEQFEQQYEEENRA
jgi:hypothetical protein